ncbi:MAG TPA: hypothetical protein VMW10_03705 [Alphaproteobacteria bacterium]|nr:hypothetical protein [Alphaproteobacteria bacterium]
MKQHTRNGIAGRLVQLQREGAAVLFPTYVTAGGNKSDRTMVFIANVDADRGLVDVLVRKSGSNYAYRTMRIDRIRRTPMIIRGRRRKRYFVSTKSVQGGML